MICKHRSENSENGKYLNLVRENTEQKMAKKEGWSQTIRSFIFQTMENH